MPPPSFQVRLTSSRTLVPAVKELVFERLDGPLDFAPGQWLNLHLPVALSSADTTGIPGVANEITRAYSIASAPVGTSSFSLAVTHVTNGPGSTALHALEPGTEIRATGPQGFFTRDADAGHPSLFVATGTGFTPLRSMLHAALHKRSHEPLWVLLGVRTPADRLYAEELTALEAQHPNLRSFFTLSRADASWTGRTGYVQTHVDSLWKELVAHSITEHQRAPFNGDAPHVYICGLERMVKAVRDKLRKELAVPRERVHSERYD